MSPTLARDLPLPPLAPPPRFSDTRFESYRPQHPSQEAALEQVEAFVAEAARSEPRGFRWPWQPRTAAPGRGLYLDGGFGVGKTHLLAAAYHACPLATAQKAYVSFQELVYLIGAKGMAQAQAALGDVDFFCVDEFELDDPGNTLIIKTFLAHVFARSGAVMTTSNTPPEAQGQGRFNAGDFKREIQSVAEHFRVVPLEGPDYRHREELGTLLSGRDLEELRRSEGLTPTLELTWPDLLGALERHHPIRYGDLIEPYRALYVSGAQTLASQNDALRFVHFIDKFYDLKRALRMSGDIDLEDLFDPSYRDGAYAKKHHRCLSRLSELLEALPKR